MPRACTTEMTRNTSTLAQMGHNQRSGRIGNRFASHATIGANKNQGAQKYTVMNRMGSPGFGWNPRSVRSPDTCRSSTNSTIPSQIDTSRNARCQAVTARDEEGVIRPTIVVFAAATGPQSAQRQVDAAEWRCRPVERTQKY